MRLSNIENKFFDFFKDSKIINFLTPEHWYTWILLIIFLVFTYKKIKKLINNISISETRIKSFKTYLIIGVLAVLAYCLFTPIANSIKEKSRQAEIAANSPPIAPSGYKFLEQNQEIETNDLVWYNCGCIFSSWDWKQWGQMNRNDVRKFCTQKNRYAIRKI